VQENSLLLAVAETYLSDTVPREMGKMPLHALHYWLNQCSTLLSPQERLIRTLEEVNYQVWYKVHETEKRILGASLAALLVENNIAYIVQIGKASAFILRGGRIRHIPGSVRAQPGISASASTVMYPTHEQKTFYLGQRQNLATCVVAVELQLNDFLFLSTEEVNNYVNLSDLLVLIARNINLSLTCRQITGLVRQRGGRSNLSLTLAQFGGDGLVIRPDANELTKSFRYFVRASATPTLVTNSVPPVISITATDRDNTNRGMFNNAITVLDETTESTIKTPTTTALPRPAATLANDSNLSSPVVTNTAPTNFNPTFNLPANSLPNLAANQSSSPNLENLENNAPSATNIDPVFDPATAPIDNPLLDMPSVNKPITLGIQLDNPAVINPVTALPPLPSPRLNSVKSGENLARSLGTLVRDDGITHYASLERLCDGFINCTAQLAQTEALVHHQIREVQKLISWLENQGMMDNRVFNSVSQLEEVTARLKEGQSLLEQAEQTLKLPQKSFKRN
jgi:serine/threonine protein phosphatase PrpC